MRNQLHAVALGAAAFMHAAIAQSASAGIIVEQPDLGENGYASQDFPDLPTYTCSVFDDFTITQSYNLTSLRVYGENGIEGGEFQNTDVRLRIFSEANLQAAPIATVSGVEIGGTLAWNLTGITLGPGTYWLSAQVVRSYSDGGQWYWRVSDTTNGAHAMWHNPGGGFGYGTDPVSTSVLGSEQYDMAMRLEGDAVPAPAVLALMMVGGLARRHSRETR